MPATVRRDAHLPVAAGDTVPAGRYTCMSCGRELRLIVEGRLDGCGRCGNGHYRAAADERDSRSPLAPGRRFAR